MAPEKAAATPAKRWIPHTEYAEDQPMARTILTTHVLHRGFQSGAFVGVAWFLVQRGVSIARGTTTTPALQQRILLQLQRRAAIGGLWGVGCLTVGLTALMWNAQEIEYQDRSWRLLENEGQVECDKWSVAGSVLGLTGMGYLASRGRLSPTALTAGRASPWVSALGSAGLGNLAGVLGYLIWRKAIMGDKKKA